MRGGQTACGSARRVACRRPAPGCPRRPCNGVWATLVTDMSGNVPAKALAQVEGRLHGGVPGEGVRARLAAHVPAKVPAKAIAQVYGGLFGGGPGGVHVASPCLGARKNAYTAPGGVYGLNWLGEGVPTKVRTKARAQVEGKSLVGLPVGVREGGSRLGCRKRAPQACSRVCRQDRPGGRIQKCLQKHGHKSCGANRLQGGTCWRLAP